MRTFSLPFLLAFFSLFGSLEANSSLFPCDLPPFTLAPPEHFASCCGFEGSIDFLYLKGKISDGIFTVGISGNSTLTNLPTRGLKDFYIDWDSGFEIGLGWNFPKDQWGVFFNWFHFSSTSSFLLPFGAGIDNELFSFSPADFLSPYESSFDILYGTGTIDFGLQVNLLEAALERSFVVGPCLALTPKVGLLALFVRDDLTLTLNSATTALTFIPPTTSTDMITNRQHIDGVGIVFGLGSDWKLGCGFSLYGDFECAAVSYKAKVQELPSIVLDPPSVTPAPGTYFEVDKFDPLLRYQLGGSFDVPLSGTGANLSVSLGWEALLFFNQDFFTRYAFSEAKPLVLQGLSFSLSLSI